MAPETLLFLFRKYIIHHSFIHSFITSMLKGLYYSLVYSHLVYGIEVWGSACDTNLDKIIVLQKKAIRVITFNERLPVLPGPHCSSTPPFSRLELLKFHDIFKFQVSKFVFLTLFLLGILLLI